MTRISEREGKRTSNFDNVVVEDTLWANVLVVDNDLVVPRDLFVGNHVFVNDERLWMPSDKQQVHVFSVEDFPEPEMAVIRLEEDKQYIIESSINLNGVVLEATQETSFVGGVLGELHNTTISSTAPLYIQDLDGTYNVYQNSESLLSIRGGEITPFVTTDPTVTYRGDLLLDNVTFNSYPTQKSAVMYHGYQI